MNEVKINVSNLHLAKITESAEGELTFGKPEHIVGNMEVSRKPAVASNKLYGDGVVRKNVNRKTAYEIAFESNAIPSEWKAYMEGTQVAESGVESGTSKDEPKPFAVGWVVEKTGGTCEMIWFLYCLAEPIEQQVKQSEDNIEFTTDKLSALAMEHNSVKRFYTLVDTEKEGLKDTKIEDFFSKVQISDTISIQAGG